MEIVSDNDLSPIRLNDSACRQRAFLHRKQPLTRSSRGGRRALSDAWALGARRARHRHLENRRERASRVRARPGRARHGTGACWARTSWTDGHVLDRHVLNMDRSRTETSPAAALPLPPPRTCPLGRRTCNRHALVARARQPSQPARRAFPPRVRRKQSPSSPSGASRRCAQRKKIVTARLRCRRRRRVARIWKEAGRWFGECGNVNGGDDPLPEWRAPMQRWREAGEPF